MTSPLWTLAIVAVVACAAFASRSRGVRRRRQVAPSSVDDARLKSLQTAIDAVAIEVGRIGESQRFVNKILAERLAARERSS
ncbi:MAG TPA: hypothetical protein VN650_08655 [Gemmatimonadaceae bacterium]|nr:hypothetical protein [Gemmatimonadaceae bacterium]